MTIRRPIRMRFPFRLPTLLVLAAAIPAAAAPAPDPAARRFESIYALSFVGVSVGTATLAIERKGERYVLGVEAGLKGLAGVFLEGAGTAVSKGRLTRAGTAPSEFRLASRYSGIPIRVTMRLDEGTVRSVSVEPAVEPKPDRVPVAEADKAGITDPVGMLAVPMGDGPVRAALCDRSVAVFDGTTRSNLVLSEGNVVEVTEGPYRGPALDCRIRWVPVSGHRPGRAAVKRMAENEDMRIRLAPLPGGGLMLPLSISVPTGWGTARIEATSWGAPPPVARPAKR